MGNKGFHKLGMAQVFMLAVLTIIAHRKLPCFGGFKNPHLGFVRASEINVISKCTELLFSAGPFESITSLVR